MEIKFPTDLVIDLDNIPDDFENLIIKEFSEYTKGTHRDYTYQDKLCFIDMISRDIHGDKDSFDAVKDLMVKRFEYNVVEFGTMPDSEDYNCIEFMMDCYSLGVDESKLYHHISGDHHIYDLIMELECRAIKAVMNYEVK